MTSLVSSCAPSSIDSYTSIYMKISVSQYPWPGPLRRARGKPLRIRDTSDFSRAELGGRRSWKSNRPKLPIATTGPTLRIVGPRRIYVHRFYLRAGMFPLITVIEACAST
jgi:hypothetical protein